MLLGIWDLAGLSNVAAVALAAMATSLGTPNKPRIHGEQFGNLKAFDFQRWVQGQLDEGSSFDTI